MAPRIIGTQMPALYPKMWKKGLAARVAVAGAEVGPVAPVEVGAQHLTVRHHHALECTSGAGIGVAGGSSAVTAVVISRSPGVDQRPLAARMARISSRPVAFQL
ncbi:MAG: hypothetical protein U0W40_03175 [Acidimicrobiia bacterium]